MKTKIFLIFLFLIVVARSFGQNTPSFNEIPQQLVNNENGFVENKGQMKDVDGNPVPYVLFKKESPGMTIWITTKGLTFQFIENKEEDDHDESNPEIKSIGKLEKIKKERGWKRVDLILENSSIRKENIFSEDTISNGEVNYYLNNCPDGILNVKSYRKITIKNVYVGIDWVLCTSGEGIQHDFFVHPHTDPNQIKLLYEGSGKFELNNNQVQFGNNFGKVKEGTLLAYQQNKSDSIAANYLIRKNDSPLYQGPGITSALNKKINSKKIFSCELEIQTGKYNPDETLIIDPPLTWGTYYGGNDNDGFCSVKTDASGNIFISGYTLSTNFPVLNPGSGAYYQGSSTAPWEASILKFSNAGVPIWTTYYGGSIDDVASSLAIDPSGNVFVTGWTSSSNFPTQNPGGGAFFQGVSAGGRSLFMLEFANSGVRIWATYYGTLAVNYGYSVAIDGSGNVFVVGYTSANNFPTLNPGGGAYYQSTFSGGAYDTFILEFSNSCALLWSTYFGGNGNDTGNAIATDASGNVYVTGSSTSTNLPTLSPGGPAYLQGSCAGAQDIFILKFSNTGVMLWSTYFGGSVGESGISIAIDPTGNIFLVGMTSSSDIPTINPGGGAFFQAANAGGTSDSFILKFSPALALLWSTYYGGNGSDVFSNADGRDQEITTDPSGNLFVTGRTGSTNFPVLNPGGGAFFQGTNSGFDDSYIMEFSNTGVQLWSTYTGTPSYDIGVAVAIDPSGCLVAVGEWRLSGSNGLMNPGAGAFYVGTGGGNDDSYIMKFCNAPTPLTLTASSTNILCNGQCTGTATGSPSGGTAPYTYSWNSIPAQTAQNATGLCAGNYTLTVTDALSATSTATISITEPTAVGAIPSQTDLACNAVCNGTATVIASGGTPGYTYAWSPSGGITATANGLCSGNYTCNITDANGCTITESFSITQPPVITASATATQTSCTANTGTATATASGGTGTLTYSWSPSGGTSTTATGLAAGNYTCTITDVNGCTQTASATVTTVNGPSASLASQQNVLCYGGNSGTATVNATGGTPGYTYSWSPSGGTSATGTGLSDGNYTCTITDAAGCTTTQSIIITQPPAITATTGNIPENCVAGNGLAFVNSTGGTPGYSYLWNTASTNDTIANLPAGSYSVIVTDANGCTTTSSVIVTTTGTAIANAGSSTTITAGQSVALNGTGGIIYNWSPSTGLSCSVCQNPVATPAQTTTYCVLVTDTFGCSDSACVTIAIQVDNPCILQSLNTLLPDAFSPNDDSQNDQYCVPPNVCLKQFELKIYDRWGELVFESDNLDKCWDGTYKDKKLNTGVFAFYFNAVLTDGTSFSQKGNISLLK